MKFVQSFPAAVILLAVNVTQAADIPIANASFEADLTCSASTTTARQTIRLPHGQAPRPIRTALQ